MAEACVASAIHIVHAAGADERKDFVRAEAVTDREGYAV